MFAYARVIVAIVVIGWFIAGCENPVDTRHEEHTEAHGFLLFAQDQEVVRVEGGSSDDTLFVPVGGTSPEIVVGFLDEHGDNLPHDELDEDLRLVYTLTTDGSVELAERGTWSFVLLGIEADTSSLKLDLMHVDHSDLTTPPIPVVVR